MGPRSLQDRSKIVMDRFFSPLPFSFRFLIVFGSVLVPFGVPRRTLSVAPDCRGGPLGGPRRPWARLDAVLCPIGGSGLFLLTLLRS